MPTPDAILAFVVIVTLIVTSPGPNLFLLLRTAPTFGRSAGLANTFGFSAAILSHALLSLIGVGAIIATSALAFSILKLVGAIYLVWLGFKALRSAWKGGVSVQMNAGDAYVGRASLRGLGARFIEGYHTSTRTISKEHTVSKPMINGDHTFRTTESFDGMIRGNVIVKTGANVDFSGMVGGDLIIERGATVKLSGLIGGQIVNDGKLL